MPLGKTLIVSLIATALVGTMAAVALGPGVPEAVVEPASARTEAPPGEDAMEFMMSGGARIILEFDVEAVQDVRLRLVLTRGETTDMRIDGPGDCDNILRGANVGDGRSVRLICPDVDAGRHRVELTHRAGTVWGSLSATPLPPAADPSGSAETTAADASTATTPTTEVFEGDEATMASVTAPYPTCPLECSTSYAWGREDLPDFEVREGATSIAVTATWEARHPADAFRIGLSRLVEEKDGGRIYEGVAGAEGVGSVTFETAAPEAGMYGVGAWVASPAGADALRVIHYVVEVRYG